jgi:hypothetical protein
MPARILYPHRMPPLRHVLRAAVDRLLQPPPADTSGEWAPGSRSHLTPSFQDLAEQPPRHLLPPLDRPWVDRSALTPLQEDWRRDGVVILRNFMPHSLIDAYSRVREQYPEPGGWSCPVPYMHIPEIRDLCLYRPLSDTLHSLVGDRMGLHLNLTGWISTERNWHQDDYLNPDFINSWYCAVWIALDRIHPDCGPFQYVPGSHRWPLTRRHRVHAYLQPDEARRIDWPKIAERFVNQAFEREIERVGAPVRQFIAEKGDVLIWHGRLAHRGSEPRDRRLQRKALIGHFSALSKRRDMPAVAYTDDGVPYFLLHGYGLDGSMPTGDGAAPMMAMGKAAS